MAKSIPFKFRSKSSNANVFPISIKCTDADRKENKETQDKDLTQTIEPIFKGAQTAQIRHLVELTRHQKCKTRKMMGKRSQNAGANMNSQKKAKKTTKEMKRKQKGKTYTSHDSKDTRLRRRSAKRSTQPKILRQALSHGGEYPMLVLPSFIYLIMALGE